MTGPLDALQARDILQRADSLAAASDYEAASAWYARVIGNGDPTLHTAALLGYADSRYRIDDEEGALQAWIVATQAPENPFSWRAWVALAGARVRQADLAGAVRCYRVAERRAPPEERAAIASRLGWLNKEMGNAGTAQRYFGRARASAFTPYATYAVLAITVLVSIAALFLPTDDLVNALALDKEALRAGEWWRLLTVTLVHGGVLHLLFNMYALYIVGPLAEALYGRVLFLAFYLLAAASGSVGSYLVIENASVGASGAVFGLFGLLAVATFVHKPALGRQGRAIASQIAVLIVINLAIGFGLGGAFGAQIDNAAHVGGLIGGSWLGLAIAPRGVATLRSMWQAPATADPAAPDPRVRTVLGMGAILLLVLAIVLGLSVTPMWAAGG